MIWCANCQGRISITTRECVDCGRTHGICKACTGFTPAGDEDYCRICVMEGRNL